MGLSGPKSLLEVKPGTSFLDVIATQVLALRERHGARLPLVVMNSAVHPGAVAGGAAPLRRPARARRCRWTSCRAASRSCARTTCSRWSGRRTRTWSGARPGTATSTPRWPPPGCSTTLLGAGLRWIFVSNSDNLGALADVRIAAWVADEEVPFAMEAVRGTPADRKGGHLARRDDGGQVVLRETAQVPDGDPSFGDVDRWRYYNTNNLWVDLQALKDLQAADPGAPVLPLIVNRKTVDPRDKTSTAGDPAGDGDGRRRRLDPRCAGGAGAAVAVRAGEDDERPAGGALRCLRADHGRADGADLRRARTGGHARRRPLQVGPRLRAAVPRRCPVAAAVRSAGGRRATSPSARASSSRATCT